MDHRWTAPEAKSQRRCDSAQRKPRDGGAFSFARGRAERAGFEPATHLSARTRFPVALLRPLGHLSEGAHRNPDYSPKSRTAHIIPTKKRIETKTNQPRLRPGNSGRERGMSMDEDSANTTNARPASPSPSWCAVESARTTAGNVTATAVRAACPRCGGVPYGHRGRARRREARSV